MKTVQPIRDLKKIRSMKTLLMARNPKYAMMFSFGINSGLRVSDILALKVGTIENKDHITISEKKTSKQKRFLINKPLQKEISLYIKEMKLKPHDYLIKSRQGENCPLSRYQAYRVLNEAASQLGLESVGTHTMRKTFGYHHYKKYKDVAILQNIFNHSAPSITLRYIGISDDEKDKTMENFYLS